MVDILQEADKIRKTRGGRKNKLSIEDMLLMTLEYLREYRTYLSIGRSYGFTESGAYKIIRWVEDTLVKHPKISLPGKKVLLEGKSEEDQSSEKTEAGEVEVVLIDATETPIERPKKSRNGTIQAKVSVIQ